MWVFDRLSNRMIQKDITFVPGLFKIFDEILVNAADNKQRDNSMDTIKVTIDKHRNFISVWNNGRGIPVTIHKEHGIYVPELIFGNLLTSSNYDVSDLNSTYLYLMTIRILKKKSLEDAMDMELNLPIYFLLNLLLKLLIPVLDCNSSKFLRITCRKNQILKYQRLLEKKRIGQK
jgi:hypothetical protein